jgi:hypothetical protein
MKIKDSGFYNADFSLVELKNDLPIGTDEITPHCKIHGAMNKVSNNIWRCLTDYKGNVGNHNGMINERTCNACCEEVEDYKPDVEDLSGHKREDLINEYEVFENE